jgi:Na+/H+ antiporter NhaD/arsenite permease-like protein
LKFPVLLTFLIAYIFFVLCHQHKAKIGGLACLIIFCLGVVKLKEVPFLINWDVIGIFVGTFIIGELFITSRVPAFLSEVLINKSSRVSHAILFVCGLSSFISMWVENIATVLIVAPIALEICRKMKASPVPFLIGISISSNLQGTATLVGDPPSMILAGFAKLNFNQFIFFQGKPGIFFAVEIGAVASFVVLYFVFKKFSAPVVKLPQEKVKTWTPTVLLILLILSLALSSFLKHRFVYLNGVICLSWGAVALVWHFWRRIEKISFWKSFDYETVFFLMSIFIIIAALTKVGLIEDIAQLIDRLTGDSVLLTFTLLIGLSVLFSAFVDNVPYVVAMLPVTQSLASQMGISPYLFYFGLLCGACLGGNITPIGAFANVAAVGIARKNGYPISFWQFVKIGLPFTLAAVGASYIFLWIVWR